MEAKADKELRVVSIDAVVMRADGTVHDIGPIVFDDPRLRRRLWWALVGKRRSERRIAAANQYHHDHNREQ